MKFVTIASDFGPQVKSVGVMKGIILKICPDAVVIDSFHDADSFDIRGAARSLESVSYYPVGIHVCVVDPGVGTSRKCIAIKTKRGDILIGPDNGVLISATTFLGGIDKVHEISNEKYMQLPVSPIFHGRDVFSSAAGHLAAGVSISELGGELGIDSLVKAPYNEAQAEDNQIEAEVIHINKFGSLFLNIKAEAMHELAETGDNLTISFADKKIIMPYKKTFGEVKAGKELILDDDFGRVQVSLNMDDFAKRYDMKIGDNIIIKK